MMRRDFKSFKRDTNIEYYVNNLIILIETRDKPYSRILLEGILKLHFKYGNVKKEESVCYNLVGDLVKEDDVNEKTRLWYLYIRELMIDALERFPKSGRLHMLYAYIQHEKLKNKYKALFEMMITEQYKPNMQEQFSIHRYKNIIEEEMIEYDIRTTESKGMDVNIIVHFQNKFVLFQNFIEKAVNYHLDFWRELLEDSPDIQKLQNLGSKITNQVEVTRTQFKVLNEMNPNHIKCLQIYGNFLKDIVNDDQEGQRILEKAEYVDKNAMMSKQFVDNDRLKYGENSNTCIITVSGNYNEMGIIKNCNNEIKRIFGITKSDIIGQNITEIIPKVIANIHDNFMHNYFETSDPKVIGIERIVFPITKAGYIIPCSLMIKILPNLDDGVKLVGFLKDIEAGSTFMKNDFDSEEQVHYLIYGGDGDLVYGISQSCYESFGIPASLIYGKNTTNNDLEISAILPELAAQSIEDLSGTGGVILNIDTTNLHQDYMLGNNHTDNESAYKSEEDEENAEVESDGEGHDGKKMNRYRKAKIRVMLIQNETFHGLNLKVLKFVEVSDNEDLKHEKSNVKEEEEVEQEKGKEKENVLEATNLENRSREESRDRSDIESNVSANSMNEENRQIKESKAVISEKNVPKSIKCLRRAVSLLLLISITIASVELAYRFLQKDAVEEGITAIYTAYNRTDVMVDMIYQVRMLSLLANGVLNPNLTNITEASIRTNLLTLINNLQTIQFNVIKAGINMEARSGVNNSAVLDIYSLFQGNTTQITNSSFNDAMFQLITSASSV
eukprot:CAMPEP_0176470080 /NCGR_PEP_ID=MMETSP0127-20121128/40245_1 /TAXON_ID=938130 /ORGANISM="Platyophrya macrostoma, Strain WH" /LENGTH=784 /DNA_ID=CAMNT_0017864311 /DNA_START=1009 /DNA_END=3359 /DNA_ORIENTATION=-